MGMKLLKLHPAFEKRLDDKSWRRREILRSLGVPKEFAWIASPIVANKIFWKRDARQTVRDLDKIAELPFWDLLPGKAGEARKGLFAWKLIRERRKMLKSIEVIKKYRRDPKLAAGLIIKAIGILAENNRLGKWKSPEIEKRIYGIYTEGKKTFIERAVRLLNRFEENTAKGKEPTQAEMKVNADIKEVFPELIQKKATEDKLRFEREIAELHKEIEKLKRKQKNKK